MVKLLSSNVSSIADADITIIGFPDDSKSDAIRTGAKKGPDIIRSIYNDSHYFGDPGKKTPMLPMSGIMDKKIFDFGNVGRNNIYNIVFGISSLGRIPIVLGGDHSLTSLALRAIKDSSGDKISLLYFDAHPDFLDSIRDFHGSVLSDSADCIDFRRSMLIGVRAVEPEELENINKNHLECLTPLKILEKGVTFISKRIISKCSTRARVYLSIDLDCIDPGFAPGVSYPTHAGLMPLELMFLVKKVCSNLNVVGLDIVELCPDYDHNYNTANIGARLLMEAIASLNLTTNHNLKEK